MRILTIFKALKLVQTVFMCTLVMCSARLLASSYDTGKISDESFEPRKAEGGKVYSPFANRNYPDQVLFGDTHFHTNLSFDAGLIGTSLTVHDGLSIQPRCKTENFRNMINGQVLWQPARGQHPGITTY